VLVSNDTPKFYGRLQGMFQLSKRGFLRFTVAPLNTDYDYITSPALAFNGTTFPAQSKVNVEYKFNSYRLGYAHRFPLAQTLILQGGLIGKIRQAKIAVSGSGRTSTYSNVGFVPLLHFGLLWKVRDPFEIRFDLDGAAAKQGRAFDAALEGFVGIDNEGSGVSAGVRVLEGGAENTKVNTFALVQYAFVALTKGF